MRNVLNLFMMNTFICITLYNHFISFLWMHVYFYFRLLCKVTNNDLQFISFHMDLTHIADC